MDQSPVILYYKRVGSLLEELIDFNDQVIKLTDFVGTPDSNLVGIQKITTYGLWRNGERMSTYFEQIELIKIYLKKLNNEELSTDEQNLFDSTNTINGLMWEHMADFMELLIQWIKNIIDYYSNK